MMNINKKEEQECPRRNESGISSRLPLLFIGQTKMNKKVFTQFELIMMSKDQFNTFMICLNIGAVRLLGCMYKKRFFIVENPMNLDIEIYYE